MNLASSPVGVIGGSGGGGLSEAEVDARVVAVASGVKSKFFSVLEAIYPTGSNAAGAAVNIGSAGSQGVFKAAPFDTTTQEYLMWPWAVPKNYNASAGISFIAYWAPSNTNTGTVRWELRQLNLVQGDAIDQAHEATGHFVDQAANGTAYDMHITAESTRDSVGTITKNALVNLRMGRRTDGDDYNADAMLIGFRLFWTTDAPTEN